MTTVTIKSIVGADGVLHLDVPLGAPAAGQEVEITIESVTPPMTQDQWREWVYSMAGSIPDPTFVRHEQGEFEMRDDASF